MVFTETKAEKIPDGRLYTKCGFTIPVHAEHDAIEVIRSSSAMVSQICDIVAGPSTSNAVIEPPGGPGDNRRCRQLDQRLRGGIGLLRRDALSNFAGW